jgi:hypothetical protein
VGDVAPATMELATVPATARPNSRRLIGMVRGQKSTNYTPEGNE